MIPMLDKTRFDFTRIEWKAHLDVFTTLTCVEKKYAKMAYKTWREIVKDYENTSEANGPYFSVCFTPNDNEVRVYGWRGSWKFSKNDGSFGEYLHNQIIMEVKDNMGEIYTDYYTSDGIANYGCVDAKIASADCATGSITYDWDGFSYDSCTKAESTFDAYSNRTIDSSRTNGTYLTYDGVYSPIATTDDLDRKADKAEVDRVSNAIDKLVKSIEAETPMKNNENMIKDKNNKENKNMKFNFDFGPVNPSTVRMSMYGLAVKNKSGAWVSFDPATGNIVDVDVFNFDGAKFLYKMPVAVKDIAAGDVVIHNGAPMFVLGIPVGGKTLTVVDVINGERKDIMLARSPFGFDFATKVVNFLGNMMGGAATAENPFGNMWMLMAMSGDTNFEDMLPMALMAGGNMDMSNPMLMWALMGNRTNDPMMLAMAMGMMNKPAVPVNECKCGGHCGEAHT